MPNLNDPIWGVIGVVVAVIFGIFGVIAVVIAFLQLVQNRKRLTYRIISITPLLEIQESFKDKVEIRLNGQPVRDVYMVIVKVMNSGKASIRPDDYDRPLSLSVTNGKIISADVMETKPKNLGEIITSQEKSQITFKKNLYNSKDSFVLKLLVSDFNAKESKINMDGRIVGVQSIEEVRENAFVKLLIEQDTMSSIVGLLLFAIPGIGGLAYFFTELVSKLVIRRSPKD